MPTSVRSTLCLVDTSAAVAFLVADHEHHAAVFELLADRELGLAGHAAFQTFSVLTRLPPPARRTPVAVSRLLATNFPHSRVLSADRTAALLAELADHGIAGVRSTTRSLGATAVEHGLRLVSRDRRALETYRELGADVEMIH